ncbi:hypothetical protein DFR86_02180 [Acidianus sulfidivorans JP7]|uniref:KAP NTPase domain-containing protein n=1 Tax=Acidianus sulfidivorans JP7 TaxID=619593 RepID=A0A2U9IKM3_9CREN|nr:hypothetical protein [Acidianus sulfidivorans]AWR96474.1 hypothetical protein DFR86_02180 [Acidianus sulfidivorans JP7]
MTCNYRISETAADSSTLYKLYLCITGKTRYLQKLRFFNQIGWEIKRLESKRESPEIITVLADWGQGKSSFFDIIEEALKERKIPIEKSSFIDLLKKNDFSDIKDKPVYLIDEVESSVDYATFSKYEDNIRDFWITIKELANSKGNNIIYLSMTPSAYSKVFGVGGQLSILFPETYYSFIQRTKVIQIYPPTKLEYLAMLDCLFEFNSLNKKLLKYLDLPYWTISQERRKYTRLFNDIICKSIESKDTEEQIFKEIEASKDLNDEGETIKEDIYKIENNMDQTEINKFHKILLSRIFTDDDNIFINSLNKNLVKGFLIDYQKWIELSKDYEIPQEVEDFLIYYNPDKDFDKSLYVFISNDINKVIYEGVNIGDLQKIYEKAKFYSKSEAYAVEWNFFETLVNTNISGLVIDFKNREIKEKALKFVNENLLDISAEVDSIISLLRAMNFEISEKSYSKNIKFLKIKATKDYNIIVYKPDNDLDKLYDAIKRDTIHGIILLDKIPANNLDSLSIQILELNLSTPIKRQLLYLLFHYLHEESTKIKYDIIQIRLGELLKNINEFFDRISDNLNVPQLPLAKGNKRPIQSINWVFFAPVIFPQDYEKTFIDVNDIVNDKFRIFGSKQFHLEDIETSESFKDDILEYFKENGILNIKDNIIYYDDLAGPVLKKFSKIFSGYLKQKTDNPEDLILEYIYSISGIKDTKPRIYQILYKIYEKSPSLDFLIYSSVFSGEIIQYLNAESLCKDLKDKIDNYIKEIKDTDITFGYFITAKKRDSGIRTLKDMQASILKYYNSLEIAMKNKDYKNFLRIATVILTLYSLFKEFENDTVYSQNVVNKIKSEILDRINIISRAKKFLNISENLDEEKELNEILDEDIEKHINEIQNIIAELNRTRRTEELKTFIEAIQKSSNIDSNNLYLIIWEIYKASIEGVLVPFFDELKNSRLYRNSIRLRDIGLNINRLQNELDTIEKINPEINKLKTEVQTQKNKINQLISEIKGEINEFS